MLRLPVRNFDPLYIWACSPAEKVLRSPSDRALTCPVHTSCMRVCVCTHAHSHTRTLSFLSLVPQLKNRELLVAALWLILIARPGKEAIYQITGSQAIQGLRD